MLTDINQTYLGDYFTVYTNIKSLYHIPEINIVLYANYTSIKIKNIKHFFIKNMQSTCPSKTKGHWCHGHLLFF